MKLTEQEISLLKQTRESASVKLHDVEMMSLGMAFLVNDPSGMTQDYIWGNCTLEQLLETQEI